MKALHSIAIVIGVGFLCAGGWLLFSRQLAAEKKFEREAAALRRDLAASNANRNGDVTNLIAERLRAEPGTAIRTSDSARTDEIHDDEGQKAEDTKLSAAERTELTAQRLEESVLGEPIDPRWSSQVANEASRVFSSVTGSRLESAECRTNICRFVVSSESLKDQRDIARHITGIGPFAEDVWYHYDRESKPPKTVLYVSRHGVPLMSVIKTAAPGE